MKGTADELAATIPPRTGETLNVVELWPDLFEGLDPVNVQAVSDAAVANWHEGWTPNREEIADLIARLRGEIDRDELIRRSLARAAAAREQG